MRSSLVKIATDSSVPKLEENHLPMPHIVYGLIAFGVFLALLGILWTFRNSGAPYREGTEGEKDH